MGQHKSNCCMIAIMVCYRQFHTSFLKNLYNSPSMQQFLNGTTPYDLYKKKTIYNHGTLQNVTDSV